MTNRLIIFLPILLLILGGCAVMKVSLLEDALPREQGDWEIEPYISTGVPFCMYDIGPVRAPAADKGGALMFMMALDSAVGVRVGYSVQPNIQITSWLYFSGMGVGLRQSWVSVRCCRM